MTEKKLNVWTPEQLAKMNEEAFLVEMLDMIKLSPEISDDDSRIEAMKEKLKFVEASLEGRLDQL